MSIWNEIKHALNSTIGKENFSSLDRLLNSDPTTSLDNLIRMTTNAKTLHKVMITSDTIWTVPRNVGILRVSACASGGKANGTVGGNAGQFIIDKLVYLNGAKEINVIVGEGNTVFGEFFTLTAASYTGEPIQTNKLGYLTGYDGNDGKISTWNSGGNPGGSPGKGGKGGAFGYGGSGGGGSHSRGGGSGGSGVGTPSKGELIYNGGSMDDTQPGHGASGGKGSLYGSGYGGTGGHSYCGCGGGAGGYGAGAGGGSSEYLTTIQEASPGMVIIEW